MLYVGRRIFLLSVRACILRICNRTDVPFGYVFMPDAQGSEAHISFFLIGSNPRRGSAAPQPISRAERHTRTARRFGLGAITAFQSRTLSTSRFLLVRELQPCALHCERDWREFFCQDVVTKPYQRSFDDLYEGA